MHPITAPEFSRPPATDRLAGSDAGIKRSSSHWAGIALLLTCLTLQDAWGLALGQARVESALGEPLRAGIDLPALSAEEAETLQVVIPDTAAFQAAGLEYRPALNNLVLQLERRPGGRAWLSLQGRQGVNDIYLDLLLQANWQGGQLTRHYSLLLNPASGTPYPAEAQAMPSPLPALSQTEGIPLPPAQPGPAATPGAPEESRPRQPEPRTLPTQAPAVAISTAAAVEAQDARPADPATTTPLAPARPAQPGPAPDDPSSGSWLERLSRPVWLGAAALLLACLARLWVWQRKRQGGSLWSGTADDSSASTASSASATPLECHPEVTTPAAGPALAPPRQDAKVNQTQDPWLEPKLDPNETMPVRDDWDVNADAPALTAAGHDTMLAIEPREQIPHKEQPGLPLREDNTDPDPLATQMELAEEFVALGDVQAARPLAERVQALATGELQSRARALLQQLDAGPH